MGVFDRSLQTRVGHETAIRYNAVAYQWGAAVRAVCVCALWTMLAWFPPDALPRASAQLLLVTAGAITTWVHYGPGYLGRVSESRFSAISWAGQHLSGVKGRATVDVSGVLEGFGILAAALLYVGPVAVIPLPDPVYALGLVVITVHVWSAMSQAMIDAGWYNPELPPARALVRLRPLIPVGLAAVSFTLFAWPLYIQQEDVAVGIVGVSALAASFLLLFPYALMIEASLKAGSDTWRVEEKAVREEDALEEHSKVKNAWHGVLREAEYGSGAGAETRALIKQLGLVVEEARRTMLGDPGPQHSIPTLVERLQQIMPEDEQQHVMLEGPDSADVRLARTDYGLLSRALPDLVINAWKAGARHVWVTVRVEEATPRPWILVWVTDDGPGMPPGASADPYGSLHVLQSHLSRFDGRINHQPRLPHGTRACARWRSSPR